MKRLILILTVLTLILSGAITLARLAGGATEPPAFGKWFTNADGTPCEMPCLFGIRVGVTRFDEVEGILKAHPVAIVKDKNEDYSVSSIEFGSPDTPNIISKLSFEQNQGGFIKSIHYNYLHDDNEKRFSFSSVLVTFGAPEFVQVNRYTGDKNRTMLLFFNRMVAIDVSNLQTKCRFDLNAKVNSFSFFNKEDYPQLFEDLGINSQPYLVTWAGFSLSTYWQRYYSQWKYKEIFCTP